MRESAADWTPRRVYRHLCRLFRIEPPFYQNREFTRAEFEASSAEFVTRALQRESARLRESPERAAPWPAEAFRVWSELFDLVEDESRGRAYFEASPADQARMRRDHQRRIWAGRLLFADTAGRQARSRRELRRRLKGPDSQVKRLCRELLRVLPPKMTEASLFDEWSRRADPPGLLRYRASRQSLWAFLKGEAREGGLRSPETARDLAATYPYLRHWSGKRSLTAAEIEAGIKNPHQADDDADHYFGLASTRQVLSRRRAGPHIPPQE